MSWCAADSKLWDPRYHGSVMMVPVLYCTCIMAIMAATFVLFVALRLWQHGVQKRPFRAHAKETQDAEEVGLPCCAIQIIAAREPLYFGVF